MNMKTLIVGILIGVLLMAGAWWFASSKDDDAELFANNERCAEFKEQAANRIRTYYTNGDVDNVYPDEIFYSQKAKSCIVLWTHSEYNENGRFVLKVIFDAVTNKDLYSETLAYYIEGPIGTQPDEYNADIQKRYDDLLNNLRD